MAGLASNPFPSRWVVAGEVYGATIVSLLLSLCRLSTSVPLWQEDGRLQINIHSTMTDDSALDENRQLSVA